MLILFLSGCAAFAPKPPIAFTPFDDSNKKLRAEVEYNSVPYTDGYRCIGQAKIENYGSNNYRSVALKVSFYTDDRELVATDNFFLNGGLMSYSKVSIDPGSDRMLKSADGYKVWLGCPKDKLKKARFEFMAF